MSFDSFTPTPEREHTDPQPLCVEGKSVKSEAHPGPNEDAMIIDRERNVFAVFDGMGGHDAGSVSSRIAQESVTKTFIESTPPHTLQEAHTLVELALVEAHEKVLTTAQEKRNNMGTTASVVYIFKKEDHSQTAIVGNVGDSRVYLCRQGKLDQITLDDSNIRKQYPNEAVARRVQKTLSNTRHSFKDLEPPLRHLFASRIILSQYCGQEPDLGPIRPRMHVVDVVAGDRLLICSDGICDNCTDTEMEEIISSTQNYITIPDLLITKAREISNKGTHRSKMDDMSAIAIEVE